MKTADNFRGLAKELELDRDLLDQLLEKVKKAYKRAELAEEDELDWSALGYTLHNVYCLFENYFLRIAKFFENGLDPKAWHAELIDRMCIEIPGQRPRLFDGTFAARMDPIRRFRHAFRNLYQGELDPRRLRILADDLPSLINDFQPCHRLFVAALEIIAGGLDDSR
jgi:hypothetical protein